MVILEKISCFVDIENVLPSKNPSYFDPSELGFGHLHWINLHLLVIGVYLVLFGSHEILLWLNIKLGNFILLKVLLGLHKLLFESKGLLVH